MTTIELVAQRDHIHVQHALRAQVKLQSIPAVAPLADACGTAPATVTFWQRTRARAAHELERLLDLDRKVPDD